MLGDHGARFSVRNIDLLSAELQAIKEVADEFPDKIMGIMMPQIISVDEFEVAKKVAHDVSMPSNTKIGIMVETPAAVQIIDDFCKAGIKFISFGTNDLTQFTLAIDRNNPSIQSLYNEMHPAVLNSISSVIRTCRKYGVETSICGQAGSRPEMARFLVKEGINSISCNADAARLVSENVAAIEQQGTGAKADDDDTKADDKEEKHHAHEQPMLGVTPVTPQMSMSANMKDEDLILRALEGTDEYNPGAGTQSDVPSLNDAIPIDSEHFNMLKEDRVVKDF
jgi:phosphoenolpyruvate-protein kinase (PTS system EI component)